MAKERKTLQVWEGVKFQNFPLNLEKTTQNGRIYIFGGRNYSVTGEWGGVDYRGRYRFHTPILNPEEICEGVWTFSKMWEKVDIVNAKGEKGTVQRECFTLQPYEGTIQHYVAFIGGHYKTTFAGFGNFFGTEIITNMFLIPIMFLYLFELTVEVIATTSNSCRSGRFGSFGVMVIASEPIEVGSEGVF